MYPSSDKETRTERKNKKGKGRREGSWKYMIAIGCTPNCWSTLINSHHHPMMYNTITGQVAVADINTHQADELGTTVQKDFIASHPGGIRNIISSKGKTMKSKKHKQRLWATSPCLTSTPFSLDSLSLVRSVTFQSPSPALLINDGCLRKSDKSILTQKLGSIISSPFYPDILIIDGNQFLNHVVWPVSCTVAGIAATIMARLGMLPNKLFLIFYRYDGVNAKGPECMRRAGDESTPIYVSIHRYLL